MGKRKSSKIVKSTKSVNVDKVLHQLLRVEAAKQGKRINQLLEEILRNYWKL
jgi:predicted HicB family RNase H-like nuclease